MSLKKLTVVAAGLLAAGAAFGQANPYTAPDDSWISIDGVVESVSADTFSLDYGDGSVTVEMDDGDRDADAYKLIPGDKVNVVGMVDDDLFEMTTIEASSVYVEKLGTTFYASAMDEDDVRISVTTPVVISETLVQGTVDSVGDDQFTVDTGADKLVVQTEGLGYDPLDDEGYQKVEVGDRVSVTGNIDAAFFGGLEFAADSIVILEENGGETAS